MAAYVYREISERKIWKCVLRQYDMGIKPCTTPHPAYVCLSYARYYDIVLRVTKVGVQPRLVCDIALWQKRFVTSVTKL